MFALKFKIKSEMLLKSTIMMKKYLQNLFSIDNSIFNSLSNKKTLKKFLKLKTLILSPRKSPRHMYKTYTRKMGSISIYDRKRKSD